MKDQIEEYKRIIATIRASKHFIVDAPEKITFDWNKVTFAMDLWVTDNKLRGTIDPHSTDIYLDNGIKKLHFEKFEFNSIRENVDSKNNPGIRVTDLLVAIAGNYIKSLHQGSRYDRNEPEKAKRLSEDFFDLTNEQFNLLKLMNTFFFSSGQYSIVTDTFFDDEIIFESFLNYVDKFDTFEKYNVIKNKFHVEEQFKLTQLYFYDRWTEALENDPIIKKTFESTRNAVESGILRPL